MIIPYRRNVCDVTVILLLLTVHDCERGNQLSQNFILVGCFPVLQAYSISYKNLSITAYEDKSN